MSKYNTLSKDPKGALLIADLESELTTTELKAIVGGARGTAGSGNVSIWSGFKSLVFGVDANFYQDEAEGK